MITVLAEKPSVGKDIARFLGAKNRHDGYMEGNGYFVTWAFGHLVELADTKVYGYGRWELPTLPLIPETFVKRIKEDEGAKKQYATIVSLFEQSERLICATDSGREGELIFRYIYELSKCQLPFERLWISSLTDEALKKGFANLKAGSDYDPLFYSARSRSEADWLVGINATMAMTVKSMGKMISLGRVQTPTLGLVVKRFIENRDFKPTDYFTPQLQLHSHNIVFNANYEKNCEKKELAETILKNIGASIRCKEVVKKEVKEYAPTLYDLTLLQQVANKKLGFSAQQTLDVAQSLYERHKILSYPRTSSCYLSDDLKTSIPELFKTVVKKVHPAQTLIDTLINEPLSLRPFDNTKVTDHHAIIPTEVVPNLEQLTQDEKDLYLLVIYRFVEAFCKPCIKDTTQLVFEAEVGLFKANGVVIRELGWREVQNTKDEEEEDKNKEENQKLPPIQAEEDADVRSKKVISKKTVAPALLTEATLLKGMETAGKYLEDESLKESLKACGIGTPATRSNIIETLIKRGFIEREGKGKKQKLIATNLGIEVFQKVEHLALAKPDLTGQWEQKLNLMAEGKYEAQQFDQEIRSYTKEVIEDIKNLEGVAQTKDSMGVCPQCEKGAIVESPKAYSCNRYREGCKFAIWKVIAEKEISKEMAQTLLKEGKTKLLKGFKNKEGEKFDAVLVLKKDAETCRVVWEYPNAENSKPIAPCPKCQTGQVIENLKAFGCNRFKEGCDFKIWKELSGKKITQTQVKQLLKGETTAPIEGFKNLSGREFTARLKLNFSFKVAFQFEN